jgi:hypothetical protein
LPDPEDSAGKGRKQAHPTSLADENTVIDYMATPFQAFR